MMSAWKSVVFVLGVWAVAQTIVSTPVAEAQLSPFFYTTSCPLLLPTVGLAVKNAIQNQSRVAASLLRLHFHDCFVQGCDGSVLLDNSTGHETEKDAPPNKNSLTPFAFETVDVIKAAVEKVCPGVVSCADIVTLAAFFSIILSGGPFSWVPLGRRDSFFPNISDTSALIGPDFTLDRNKALFAAQNLTVEDLVALSGAHTIGLASCAVLQNRLYKFGGVTGSSDPTLNTTLLAALRKQCPNGVNLTTLNEMDPPTPTVFDNHYYKNLLLGDGLFTTDQALYSIGNDTKVLVKQYANNQTAFFNDFATAITKMGNLRVLTGTKGEVRRNCRVRNPTNIQQVELKSPHVEQAEAEEAPNLEQFMTNVMRQMLRMELEELVESEETVSETHADM